MSERFYTIKTACDVVEGVTFHNTKEAQEAFIEGYDCASGKFGGDGFAISEDCIDELSDENKEYALKLINESRGE